MYTLRNVFERNVRNILNLIILFLGHVGEK